MADMGTCESCGKAASIRYAKAKCDSCGKEKGVKICDACMGKGGSMSKFGGKTCEACGGSMKMVSNKMASVPTSYSMMKKAMLEEMSGVLTTKQRKKAPSVFSPGKKVNPDKGRKTEEKHFPIPDLAHARNALSRVEQYDSVPDWFNGSLEDLKAKVKAKVYRKYPELKKRKEKREGK
mgnify:CR=1 FL=1